MSADDSEIAIILEIMNVAQIKGDLNAIKEKSGEADGKVTLTKTEADQKIKEIDRMITATEERIRHVQHQTKDLLDEAGKQAMVTAAKITGTVRRVWGLFARAMSAVGNSLPPILSALVNTMFTVAQALFTIAKANLSNPYTFMMGLLALTGAGISIQGAMRAQADAARITQSIQVNVRMEGGEVDVLV